MRILAQCTTAAVLLFVSSGALAQLTDDQRKCSDKMNNDARKVLDQEAKKNRKLCVKEAVGTNQDITLCVNTQGEKAAAKQDKLVSDFADKCAPPNLPAVGVNGTGGGDAIGDAATGAANAIMKELFAGSGEPGLPSTDPIDGIDEGDKCQDKLTQRTGQLAVAQWKAFRKCLKAAATLDDLPDFSTCIATGIADGETAKGQKVTDDVTNRCASFPPPGTEDGACGAQVTAATFAACIRDRVDCRVCEALNTATNGRANCDQIDNGVEDGSCSSPPAACSLTTGSQIEIRSAGLNQTPAASGTIEIDCEAAEDGNGKSACACGVQPPGLDPVSVPGVGFACVKPAISASCPAGEIDCDGGNNLNLELNGNDDINNNDTTPFDGMADQLNPCTSNADCAADCATFCAPDAVFQAGCAGFCTAGAQMACTTDGQCAVAGQGACNGGDGVARGNLCDCTCIADAVPPAGGPGALGCQLALNLTVEVLAGTPCDGVGVVVALGDTCAPFTTETGSVVINNANDSGTTLPPSGPITATGSVIPCATLKGGSTSGLELFGGALFYGSTVGDITTAVTLVCE